MITTTHYKLTHIDTLVEEDSYAEGCLPETGFSKGRTDCFNITFTGNNRKDIINNLQKLFTQDITEIQVDTDDYATFVQVSVIENKYAEEPTQSEIDSWKRGKTNLFNVIYIWEFTKETMETAVKVID